MVHTPAVADAPRNFAQAEFPERIMQRRSVPVVSNRNDDDGSPSLSSAFHREFEIALGGPNTAMRMYLPVKLGLDTGDDRICQNFGECGAVSVVFVVFHFHSPR